jgi:hypothetical protein
MGERTELPSAAGSTVAQICWGRAAAAEAHSRTGNWLYPCAFQPAGRGGRRDPTLHERLAFARSFRTNEAVELFLGPAHRRGKRERKPCEIQRRWRQGCG